MLISALILSVLLAGAVEDDVRCREIDFSLSVAEGDRETFAGFLHPEVRFVAGGEPAAGREGFIEQWAPFFTEDGPEIQWRPERVVALPTGDLAVSRGPYRVLVAREGEMLERWGEFMSIWQRTDVGWVVIYDVAARDTMEPTEAQRQLLDTGACQ